MDSTYPSIERNGYAKIEGAARADEAVTDRKITSLEDFQ
jgi:hypothetical protein